MLFQLLNVNNKYKTNIFYRILHLLFYVRQHGLPLISVVPIATESPMLPAARHTNLHGVTPTPRTPHCTRGMFLRLTDCLGQDNDFRRQRLHPRIDCPVNALAYSQLIAL
uniref:(northern house mosquito) hypothetical protein n=1 Tax=Culex pipiens TaxID=7175 RepID=A0A8D8BF66_CULPI